MFYGLATYIVRQNRGICHLIFKGSVVSSPFSCIGICMVDIECDNSYKGKRLTDYTALLGKYVVFFFYPLDFTFVCPTEIIAYSDRADEFKKINCEVIGASVDSHFCHLAW